MAGSATLPLMDDFYFSWGLMVLLACLCFYQRYRLQLLKRMLNLIDYPIWLSTHKGKVMYSNDSYKALFEEGSFTKGLSRSIFPSANTTAFRKAMVVQGERRIYAFFQKPLGPIHIAWGIDQTKMEDLTQELKRHADAYREVLENLSAGVTIYGSDRRLKFYNHAYAKMFSFNKEWLDTEPSLGEMIDDLWSRRLLTEHADHQAYRRHEMEKAISVLTPQEELIHLPNERSFRRIMAPHPLGGSFYIFEDVTSALSLERQYNTQLAVQKASLDNLYEGIAVFGSDNRLRLANPSFERLWESSFNTPRRGRHISELLDSIKTLFYFEGEWEDYRDSLVARITDRIPKSFKFERTDKKVISFSYVPLPDGSHLMTYVDVTDSHHIEQVLREKNKVLETNDRLRSEFIANVSYELRNPLQAILGFAELLNQQHSGPLNDRQRAFCGHILNATQVLLELVNTILDISTLESGALVLNYQVVDISKILASVIRIAKARAKQMGVNLLLRADKDLGAMEADRARLKQILFNLLSNCLHWVEAGQELILTASSTPDTVLFQLTYDSRSLAGKSKGLGLGLSLVKSLVELHKGSFHEEPEAKGQGALLIKIPRCRHKAEEAA